MRTVSKLTLIAALLPAMAFGVHAAGTQGAAPKPSTKATQTKSQTKAGQVKKAAAKSTPSKKAAAKPAAKTNKVAVAAGAGAATATAVAAARSLHAVPLGNEQLALAERVHTGNIPCELGASVHIAPDTNNSGYFHISGKGFKYHMAPVATSTGALRLEDSAAGAVWIQIANKSMLMNQKLGQRLADECMSPQQVLVADAIKKTPPPSLLDPVNPPK